MLWKPILVFHWSGVVVAEWCAHKPLHFGCKCEPHSSEVFVSFSVVAGTDLSAFMQCLFLMHADVSEAQLLVISKLEFHQEPSFILASNLFCMKKIF